MHRFNPCLVLNKIMVKPWVLGTARKMQDARTDTQATWNNSWLERYRELGGCSKTSGSKGCPRAAAYGLWFLGRLRETGRPFLSWTVPQIDRDLGKNAAYAVIAANLLQQGASPAVGGLWPLVQDHYRAETGHEPAGKDQGEIKLVVALFQEEQLARGRG